jgi:hypothetical protein
MEHLRGPVRHIESRHRDGKNKEEDRGVRHPLRCSVHRGHRPGGFTVPLAHAYGILFDGSERGIVAARAAPVGQNWPSSDSRGLGFARLTLPDTSAALYVLCPATEQAHLIDGQQDAAEQQQAAIGPVG